MSATTKKEVLAQLAEAFPGATQFVIEYGGYGDDFSSFHSLDVTCTNKENEREYDRRETEFLNIAGDYIWNIFDSSSDVSFNDDGSEGTIKFDMINKVVTLHNYWIIREKQSCGEEEF
jgi:hypothetical protein